MPAPPVPKYGPAAKPAPIADLGELGAAAAAANSWAAAAMGGEGLGTGASPAEFLNPSASPCLMVIAGGGARVMGVGAMPGGTVPKELPPAAPPLTGDRGDPSCASACRAEGYKSDWCTGLPHQDDKALPGHKQQVAGTGGQR